ncbi:YecA family protein [Bacillus changyiensis]|uniref:YecA family protein n=1 Tax=Bacillus changyiensis TaxID=3004103 RepID=UPI003743449A
MIFNNASLNDTVKYFQHRFEFPDIEFIHDLAYYLTELLNHSRKWMLKSHTPKEISQRRESMMESPSVHPQSNVMDFKSRKAIGRNDPCPCGSGKKYKKCYLNSS